MEGKGNLRRAQSLRSVPSCDKPEWAEVGLRDRKKSVSQLVARYQHSVEVSTSVEVTTTDHEEQKKETSLQISITSVRDQSESKLESLLRKNDMNERSRGRTALSRSKSMESLPQHNAARNIGALKALFESKVSQREFKSSLGAVGHTLTPKMAAPKPVVNGEVEEREALIEDQGTHTTAVAPTAAATVKEELLPKVMNKPRPERRKTISGVNLENIASHEDDKRKSIADFRDSSFTQGWEKLPVSVKAISASYLSKVAAADPASSPVKQAQQQAPTGKSGKPIKMAEDTHQMKDGPESGDISRTQTQPSFSALYQQRQKCELRRLLKHTCPELKTLEGAVDEELAEVLSFESAPTDDNTGYEGEVLSRRWIFENCAVSGSVEPHVPMRHTSEGAVQRDVRRTSAVEQPWENLMEERVKGTMDEVDLVSFAPGDPTECGEEMVRIDVQSARRMFESQTIDNSRGSKEDVSQSKCIVSEDERGAVKKRKQAFETCDKLKVQREIKSDICFINRESISQKQAPGTVNSPSTEHGVNEIQTLQEEVNKKKPISVSKADVVGETNERGSIHTSAALFANNPFIAANIVGEQSHGPKARTQNFTSGDFPLESRAHDDQRLDNVKNRAQLFESMPFDRINQENKEERESMMESISETLNSLYHFNAIHSHGSIIEVMETGNAKRSKYTLSQSGPEIDCDELAEGGIKNCILHLLPRVTLKSQLVYLKEDEQGNVEFTLVDVPVHQRAFTANQEREFRTANVVQLIEDILSQDSSLRKGVMIQEDVQGCTEVTVYSLYYHAEGEVKRYCPLQGRVTEPNAPERSAGDAGQVESQDVRKGDVRSTISSLMASAHDHTREVSFRPEVDVKGNVKLFKSCIEKGDLEYLKALQLEASEEELSNQTGTVSEQPMDPCHEHGDQMVQGDPEWVPVDVKKLKSMFSSGGSADQSRAKPKRVTCGDIHHLATQSPADHSQSRIRTEMESISESGVSLSMFSPGQKGNRCLSEECDMQAPGKGTFNLKLQSQDTPCCPQTQEDTVQQTELVEVVDDDEDEISNLYATDLQQAKIKEKAIHHITQERQQCSCQGLSKESQVIILRSSDSKMEKSSGKVVQVPQTTVHEEKTCWEASPSPSYITSDSDIQISKAYGVEGQDGTEVVQKGHLKAAIKSLQSASTEEHQEVKDEVVRGNLQAALDSLGKSNINVNKGDFRTAMIHKNYSKTHTESFKKTEAEAGLIESKSIPSAATLIKHGQVATEERSAVTAEPTSPGQTTNKPATGSTLKKQPQTESVAPTPKRSVGPKPAIPPKPDHLKANSSQVKSAIHMATKSENVHESQPVSSVVRTQLKEEKPPLALSIKPMSYKDALCKGLLSHTTDCVAESKLSPMDPERQAGYSLEVKTEQSVDANQHTEDITFIHHTQTSQTSRHRNTGNNSPLVNDSKINLLQDSNATEEGKSPPDCLAEGEGDQDVASEDIIGFQEALQNFEAKKGGKRAPLKPKRVKIAQTESKHQKQSSESSTSTTCIQSVGQNIINTGQMYNTQKTCEQSKVVMREKKARSETEDERRQRLSVHMDEILRGNVTTAMKIFDNLREQEQLQTILAKVEEIEEDTSKVDVKSLRSIFENVPAWVVTPRVKKPHKHTKVEQKVERSVLPKDDTESGASMAIVFGDLERASEEIMKLKDQTLARLMDIEEAIQKALYSVSTLKSDSDIAGLSGLFKESLGTSQSSPTTSNIRKISIGSSRAKQDQVKESSHTGLSVIAEAQQRPGLEVPQQGPGLEVPGKKPQSSPPSSPSFISIESAARKKSESASLPPPLATTGSICQHSSKPPEKFRSTKILQCNSNTLNEISDPKEDTSERQASCSPCNPLNQKRQVTVLKVQTLPEGNSILGTKTVQRNYETNQYGNRIYSTKTSNAVTTQPETTMMSRDPVVTSSPARNKVVSYPEIRIPINKKPSSPQ